MLAGRLASQAFHGMYPRYGSLVKITQRVAALIFIDGSRVSFDPKTSFEVGTP